MSKAPSRVVFVGNIPYGLSEEQITDIFSSAGKVVSFRLVYDPQTGKTRGYGFAEYPDVDSAASAVRNLHDHEVLGRRLKVDFSNERPTVDDDAPGAFSHAGSNGSAYYASGGAVSLPPLPAGKEIPPGVTFTDAVSRTLNALPPTQLLDILSQMKILASSDPARATELLQQAPQLAYAVFQGLLLMNLLTPEAIQAVIDPGGLPFYPAPSAQYAAAKTPSVGMMGYAAPAALIAPNPAGYAAQLPPPMAAQDPEALMRAVMDLPQSTIDTLPDAERQQILALRANYGSLRR